jgi:hypothetical protein
MDNPMNIRQRNFIVGLIIVGLMIIGFFGLRTARAFRQFHGHPPPPFGTQSVETNPDLIRDWMTIPFIAHMYHVHPEILFEALGVAEKENREKSLKQLNEEFFPEAPGIVLEKIKTAVRAALPPPAPLTPILPATPVVP